MKETTQTKGKDEYYGFEIGEPFVLFSKVDSKKVMEVAGGKNLQLGKYVKNKRE